MNPSSFRAYVLRQNDDASVTGGFEQVTMDDLPDGDVLVKVAYTSLNYKDGLAVTNRGKVVRQYPMVPGIDLVGTVAASTSERYAVGDEVILTGWGMGEAHWGGYAEYARVKSSWLVPLPPQMTPLHAMAVGTAGLTATLAVQALELRGLEPDSGEVLVTGASGGVGSMAVAILGEWGYTVVASTGRPELADYLKALGATEVISRFDAPARPLASGRWAGAVDGVGGDTLAYILSTLRYGAAVAAYGLAGGTALNTTVLPFILRGASLIGIDSVMCPYEQRLSAWRKLELDMLPEKIDMLMQVEPLSNIEALSQQIMAGAVRGRVVVDVRR
jgi:acrylyl-CoA reductase (NADPH)